MGWTRLRVLHTLAYFVCAKGFSEARSVAEWNPEDP
jgi:hypothetical protein